MIFLTLFIGLIAIGYGIKAFNHHAYDKALLVLVFFFTSGFEIIPGEVRGAVSYFNIGIVYMSVLFFLYKSRNLLKLKGSVIEKEYLYFLLFLLSGVVFSVMYYHFAFAEVFRVIKWWIPFAGVFLYRVLPPAQFSRLLNFLIKLTLFLSILFIVQCFTGIAILHSHFDTREINEYGLARFYNKPMFSTFVLFYIILNFKKYSKKFLYTSVGVLFTALLMTQNRLEIMAVASSLIVIIFFSKIEIKRKIVFALLIGISFIPINWIMEMRDSGAAISTTEDIKNILDGRYTPDDYLNGYNGTFTFRFAMVFERMAYLSQRNLAENIWGLGMGHSDYKAVTDRYHFHIGTLTVMKEPAQLSSADCSWVGIICQWGYAGLILLFIIFANLLAFFYKNRDETLGMVAFGYLIMLFFCSFSGSWMTNPVYHMLPLMTYFYLKKTKICIESSLRK